MRGGLCLHLAPDPRWHLKFLQWRSRVTRWSGWWWWWPRPLAIWSSITSQLFPPSSVSPLSVSFFSPVRSPFSIINLFIIHCLLVQFSRGRQILVRMYKCSTLFPASATLNLNYCFFLAWEGGILQNIFSLVRKRWLMSSETRVITFKLDLLSIRQNWMTDFIELNDWYFHQLFSNSVWARKVGGRMKVLLAGSCNWVELRDCLAKW